MISVSEGRRLVRTLRAALKALIKERPLDDQPWVFRTRALHSWKQHMEPEKAPVWNAARFKGSVDLW